MLDEYLQKYAEMFSENFPIYSFMSVSESDIIKTIQKCIDKNKPYVLKVEDGIYY